MKSILPNIFPEPVRVVTVPHSAQWLAGEGAGSWIFISPSDLDNTYVFERFSPDGILECQGIFSAPACFDYLKPYTITYPTHCSILTLVQDGSKITLNPLQIINQ